MSHKIQVSKLCASTPCSPSSEAPVWKGLLAAGLYGSCSVLMTLCNKWVVSTWAFEFNGAILLGQMVVSYSVLEVLRRQGSIDIPSLSGSILWILFPLAMLYLANVAAALTALRLTSVPVYNVLKRMAPLPVMITDWWLRGQYFSRRVQLSVLTIVVGALVTGSGDLDFDFMGYSLALLSCALQAGYLVYTSKAHDAGYNSHGLLYYTSIFAIPLLLVFMVTMELSAIAQYPHWGSALFLGCLFGCFTMGTLLNYALFLCCTTNSALTTVIVGQLKGLISSVMGFILFEKVNVTNIGITGMVINTSGGALYAWAKYTEKEHKPPVHVPSGLPR